ncbi:MAG: Fe-S cluster assembly protein NifU [Chitinivibrionales bacterium]|nr:Fe-S cluster assembly protein NifU [Chitinivibrionales bacterium]
MWDYSQEVRDHFLNPKNVGEVDKPDGVGEVGNISCGDALKLTFKLDENRNITDIKFKTYGCGSAIASASMLTELVRGKSLEEAKAITNKHIAEALGGLPKEKMHCSVMGQEALEAAIKFYESGGKQPQTAKKEGTIVCTCFGVTDKEIEKAIRENKLTTVDEVTNYSKAGGGCGGCIPDIEELIAKVNGQIQENKSAPPKRMTMLQKIDKIRRVLDADVRPVLQKDGGDCEFVDIDGNTVFIELKGHCKGCTFSTMTLLTVVENALKEKVLPELVVKQA